MKKKVLGIVLLSVCLLSACQGAIADKGNTEESEFYENSTSDIKDEETVVHRDVTFINGYRLYLDEAVKEVTNEIKMQYPTVEKDKLYAFYMSSWGNVEIEPQQEGETDLAYKVRLEKAHSEYVAKKALEMGLMVMPGYTFCSFQNDNMEQMYKLYYSKTNPQPFILGRCVVIGTMEQIENLFDYTEPIDGACWCLYPAMRPDIPKIVEQMGLNNEEIKDFYYGDGENNSYDAKMEQIVGEDDVVTITVPVIVPENTVKSVTDNSKRIAPGVRNIKDASNSELLYEDENYAYYFEHARAEEIIIQYEDGSEEKLKEALAEGTVKISDLTKRGWGVFVCDKSLKEGEKAKLYNVVKEDWAGLDQAREVFFEDAQYKYYFNVYTSSMTFAYYTDGTRETITDALKAGRITMADLDANGITYYKMAK